MRYLCSNQAPTLNESFLPVVLRGLIQSESNLSEKISLLLLVLYISNRYIFPPAKSTEPFLFSAAQQRGVKKNQGEKGELYFLKR
jgi:hypothetical protein